MFKVRVGCIVACGDELALIHRQRNGVDIWTLPGGNVAPDEDIESAMIRELQEELGLVGVTPSLLFLQDMLISRTGYEPLYRKLHVIFRAIVSHELRSTFRLIEEDDLATGEIKWMNYKDAAELYLYPGINSGLKCLSSLEAKIAPCILPPMTDETYTWL